MAAFLAETLRSVQRQSFADFEVLMVDDGSADATAAIMDSFAAADPRFRALRLPHNQGIVAARNAGLAAALGRFVALQDSDDLWTPDALAHRIDLAQRFPQAHVIATDFAWFEDVEPVPPYVGRVGLGPRGRAAFHAQFASGEPVLLESPFEAVATLHFAWIGATLVDRQALAAIGNLEPSFVGPEDTLVWLRMARRGGFVFSPKVTAFYRQRPGSQVSTYDRPKERMYLRVLYRILDEPLTPSERIVVERTIAESHHIASVYFRKTPSEHGDPILHALKAVRRAPLRLAYWRNLVASLSERVAKRLGLARRDRPD